MSDLTIFKGNRYGRAHLRAETSAGRKWLKANFADEIVSFNIEHTEDMVESIEQADLTVEVQ